MKKILCVCIGNSDRSPAMAAVLGMYMRANPDISVESAGIGENAGKGGPAGELAVAACKSIGIDISGHNRRRTNAIDLEQYDLFVIVDDAIARELLKLGVPEHKLWNASINNPWPVRSREKYDQVFKSILTNMYEVVIWIESLPA